MWNITDSLAFCYQYSIYHWLLMLNFTNTEEIGTFGISAGISMVTTKDLATFAECRIYYIAV